MALQTPFALSTNAPAETPFALSTVAAPGTPFALSIVRRNKTQFALSIVDPQITDIERERARKKISHATLCALARVHAATWFYLRRGEQVPRKGTLERLKAAIAHVPRPKPNAVEAQYRAIMALLAVLSGENPEAMLAQDFSMERETLRSHKAAALRRQAMYVAAVELQIGNADLGRALGCSRQNIKQARDAVEDAREDPRLEALLDRVARLVRP